MSITSIKYPNANKVQFVSSPVNLKFQSSDSVATAGEYCNFHVDLTEWPIANDFIHLIYQCDGEVDLNFVFKNAPDTSGLQLKARGTEDMAAYVAVLVTAFQSNYFISRDFVVSASTAAISFIAKVKGLKTPTATFPVVTKVAITVVNNGSAAKQKENFKILVQTLLASNNNILFEDYLSADDQGIALIDISEILRSQITKSYTWPIDSTLIREMPDFCKEFYCRIANCWGNPRTAQAITTLANFKAMAGGVGLAREAILNDLTIALNAEYNIYDWFNDAQQFLTWHPRNKTIDRAQPERLYWLNYSTASQLRLKVVLYYTNDSSTSFTAYGLNGVSQHKVYELTITPDRLIENQVLTPVPGHYINKIGIYVADENDQQLSEIRTYHINSSEQRHNRYIIFANSPGGYDTLRCSGIGQFEASYERMSGQAILPEAFSTSKPSVQDFYIGQTQKMKVSTGLFNIENEEGREWAEYLQEIFLSKEVYEVTTEGLFRIKILNDSAVLAVDDENLYSANIEYQRTYVDALFSALLSNGTTINQSFFASEDFDPNDFELDPNDPNQELFGYTDPQ